MKKAILISTAIVVLIIVSLVCFGYHLYTGVAAMKESDDIKIPTIDSISTIEDIVQPYLNHEATKALSIAVYNKGEVSYYNYGICSDKNPVPPTNQSIYEIGSISKTFTAAVLVQMVQEGKVEYDDPISKYLPKEVVNWSDSVNITLVELATHQSGFPRLPDNHLKRTLLNMDNPHKNYSEQDLYDFLKTYQPKPKSERVVSYSNLGMGLLGHILAKINESSYDELIQNNIVKPLNMINTYAAFKEDTQIAGHNGYGKPTSQWEFQCLHGAGAVRSNTTDLMKYMITNLQAQFPFAETHNHLADFGEKNKIGLAWITIHTKDTNLELLFHNGGTGGYRSALLFSKEKQIGVVVLANSIQSVDAIGIRILELLEKQLSALQEIKTESR